MEITTYLKNCDEVKKKISTHAKDLIDLIKQHEKELKTELNRLTAQQLE